MLMKLAVAEKMTEKERDVVVPLIMKVFSYFNFKFIYIYLIDDFV